jgi:hypothetical protein
MGNVGRSHEERVTARNEEKTTADTAESIMSETELAKGAVEIRTCATEPTELATMEPRCGHGSGPRILQEHQQLLKKLRGDFSFA